MDMRQLITEAAQRHSIFLWLDMGRLQYKHFGKPPVDAAMLTLLREHREELTAHFKARFQGERQMEERALRTFCRPSCSHLTTFNLMSDGGPAWQCLHPGGWRLRDMTACPMRQEAQ